MNKIKIPPKFQAYLNIIVLFIFLLGLGIIVFKLASSQIPAQRNKLDVQIKKEQTLRSKSELLRTIDAETVKQADLTTFALPSTNSTFAVAAQLNKLAQNDLIIITNLKIGSETKEGDILSSDLSFDAEGALPTVLTFLKDIPGLAPITLIERVQINEAQETARATLRVKVFWANLPSSLPAITEPLSDLSTDEKDILLKVVNLVPPDFVLLEPQESRENANPF